MPFASESQRRLLWAKHPKIAERWSHEYPGQHDLPRHKKKGLDKQALLEGAVGAGLGYGSAHGRPLYGALRGAGRGLGIDVGAGLGMGAGGVAASMLTPHLGLSPSQSTLAALLMMGGGAAAGGLGGNALAGKLMGKGDYRSKEERKRSKSISKEVEAMGEKTSADRIAGLAYEGATLPYLVKLAQDSGLDVGTVRYLAAVAGMAPATLYKEAHADPQAFRDLYQLAVGRLKQAAGGQQGGGIGRQSSAGSARQEAQLYEMEKRLAAEEAARAGQGGAGTGINRLLKRLGVSPGSNAPSAASSSGGSSSMNRLLGRLREPSVGASSSGTSPGSGLGPLAGQQAASNERQLASLQQRVSAQEAAEMEAFGHRGYGLPQQAASVAASHAAPAAAQVAEHAAPAAGRFSKVWEQLGQHPVRAGLGGAGVLGAGALLSKLLSGGSGSPAPSGPEPPAGPPAPPPTPETAGGPPGMPPGGPSPGGGGGHNLMRPLVAGGALGAGLYGLSRLFRRKKKEASDSGDNVVVRVMKRAAFNKVASIEKQAAQRLLSAYLDTLVPSLSTQKQASLRTLQQQLSLGRPLSQAIKLAYPQLVGEQRGILAVKLASACTRWSHKQANALNPSAYGAVPMQQPNQMSPMTASGPAGNMQGMMSSVGA